MALVLTPNIDNPDGFYDALLQAHEGLGAEDSAALNARLILILANQVRDEETLRAAVLAAQDD